MRHKSHNVMVFVDSIEHTEELFLHLLSRGIVMVHFVNEYSKHNPLLVVKTWRGIYKLSRLVISSICR
ncbi:MAG TPA: hypothetical protein VJ695_02965, partial [Nitrososphaera sp.]|nr:hypothetical protein [Nitrososphaera sp.]